ncbi:Protein GVQW1 [Plecturocebus cupreus]
MCPRLVSKLLGSRDPPALASQDKKRRLTVIECGCDINMMIGLAKVADLKEFCSCIIAQTGVQCHHLDSPQPPPPRFKQVCLSLPKLRFLHVSQAGLEFSTSGDLPTSASKSAGITGGARRAVAS